MHSLPIVRSEDNVIAMIYALQMLVQLLIMIMKTKLRRMICAVFTNKFCTISKIGILICSIVL